MARSCRQRALGGLLAALGLGFSSCATVLRSGSDPVSCGSEPSGATVLVDGFPMGTTPCVLDLDASREHFVEMRLDGYQSQTRVVRRNFEVGWLILDIVPGLALHIVPILVDWITGNWKGLDSRVHIVLERVSK